MGRTPIHKNLVAGDLLFQKGHALIFVGFSEEGQPEVVECDKGPGVVRRELGDDVLLVEEVYRPKNPDLAKLAVIYAKGWASPDRHTRYGKLETDAEDNRKVDAEGRLVLDSRAVGVVEESQKGGIPAYESDAFYRTVKWASRSHDKTMPLSKSRGTTCATLAAACYQAAALNIAMNGNTTKITELYDELKDARIPKATDRMETGTIEPASQRPGSTEKFKPKRALRETVNTGFKETGTDFSKVWDERVSENKKPEQVLTRGMMVDAQFVYTPRLMQSLKDDSVGWTPVTETTTMEYVQPIAADAPPPPPPPGPPIDARNPGEDSE